MEGPVTIVKGIKSGCGGLFQLTGTERAKLLQSDKVLYGGFVAIRS